MNWVLIRRIGLGLGLALLTAIIAQGWGDWLQQQVLRPLVVGWVWFVYYVTHLPQAAVWFAALLLACLPLFKQLKFPKLAVLPPRPRGAVASKGPLSAWQQTLTLALKGRLYRQKLYSYLQEHLDQLNRLSPQARRALEQLRVEQRSRSRSSVRDAAAFLSALHTLLDELDVPGASDAAG